MTSSFPANLHSSAGAQFPALDPVFTPWEDISSLSITVDPIFSKPGSETIPIIDKDSNEPVSIIEERNRKRKLSNRLSARRSRIRKMKQHENLVSHVNRLVSVNRELTNRFRIVNHNLLFIKSENQRLLDECVILQRRLIQTNQILHFMQLQPYPTYDIL